MRKIAARPLLLMWLMLFTAIALVGCKNTGPESGAVTPVALTPAAQSDTALAAVRPGPLAPQTIVVKTTLRPAIDPACLRDQGHFALLSAPLPEQGLEPGMVQVFCAVDAPADSTVRFQLTAPDGQEQDYQAPSVQQGETTVAVLPLTLSADAQPGKWKLTAQVVEQPELSDSLSVMVKAASQPFITLSEPVPENPQVIHMAIGGLPPHGQALFAIYQLQPGQTEGTLAQASGRLLLDNVVTVDEVGRADLALDVADQPAGPYLFTLTPLDETAQARTTIELPAQDRTALAINIQRGATLPAPEQAAATTSQHLPPAPQLAEAGGGLPATTTVSLPEASLPACEPTTSPQVQLWPQSGELGQWWYGCASGFTPEKPLQVQASLANGSTATFNLTATDANGVNTFRWYSLPEEGAGAFNITISDLSGAKAEASWTIAPATRPHLLVYPHVVLADVGAQLVMTGFPPRTNVQLGLYQLDENETATLAQKMTAKADKNGVVARPFAAADALTPGVYMLMAQSAPAYQFAGIETPATAIEFFSVGTPLPERYEFYTLFMGRSEAAPTTAAQVPAAPAAAPAATPAPASSGPPANLTTPVDNSAPPTCPDAQGDALAICLMPTTIERATYVYMLMHNAEPGARFKIIVTPPRGKAVTMQVQANDAGIAEAHWYALNDERLGVYRVRIQGGGQRFNGSFKVIKAKSPHVVVQPRSPEPGTPVIISISGLKPQTRYLLARYRSRGEQNGQLQFQLLDTTTVRTGKGGGAQATFATKEADAGAYFLAALFEEDGSQVLAQELYAPGQELYLRYPFAWGQTGR